MLVFTLKYYIIIRIYGFVYQDITFSLFQDNLTIIKDILFNIF